MKKLKMNKVIGCLILLVTMLTLSLPVSASSVLDSNQLGSITIDLHDQSEKNPVKNAEITLYKVADAENDSNSLRFSFVEELKASGISVDDYHTVDFARDMADYILENNISGTALTTDENGSVKFTDLTHGIYLLIQTKSVKNISTFTPFVIIVPAAKDGEWVYDISATPKVDIIRYTDLSVKKVWNDDDGEGGSERPESVKIQLLSYGKVIDTVELSEENEWSYTWEEIQEHDGYSVKEINIPKGYRASYKKNGFQFTVTNSSYLPHTGQLNWPIPILVIAGFMLIALGYILRSRGTRYE